jgi:cyclopropane-fatty-acyl-phospholipid synthase
MLTSAALALAERGVAPDWAVRAGIRRLLRARLRALPRPPARAEAELVEAMDRAPIAVVPRAANEQHYEVPAEFFEAILGPRLKYSCAWWPEQGGTLAEAEAAMLDLTAGRAQLSDGQRVLELGCGWGSLTLWIAERHRRSHVLAVSNSATQRAFIEARARARGLDNVTVVTADMNGFDPADRFDRVVSVEMFEHMRNHRALLARVAGWLQPAGRAFVHVFCHRETPYVFEDRDESDWMARHFFTGGMMPSVTLLPRFRDQLDLEASWTVNGRHYARTLLAWLERLDAARAPIESLFDRVYGAREASRWVERWRLFLLASAELFAYRGGTEWFVAHYRFSPRA